MIVLQGFKLLPCDSVEASHSPYRLIPTLPIAVELVGRIFSPFGAAVTFQQSCHTLCGDRNHRFLVVGRNDY